MKLSLQRSPDNIGQLTIDGMPACLVLENPALKIPAGTYNIDLIYSPRFQRYNLRLTVPGRQAIEIHTGNYYRDSEGCLITGSSEMPASCNTVTGNEPFVTGSKVAYIALMARIRDYIFADPMAVYEPITLTILPPVV